MSKLVLVTGVTGQQGSAVARSLLARGHRVRGLTRRADSPRASAAVALGIEIVEGDFADPSSLADAFTGVEAVYAMTTPFEAGIDAETAQGIALVDAAQKAGVPHFVFSSVASADQATGIPHFDSKYRVEEYLRGTDLAWTITAPVYFMDNLFFAQNLDALKNGAYAVPLPADMPLQQIALGDLGAFAAHVIEDPERFTGKRIDIASDDLTSAESAAALSTALGREVDTVEVPLEAIRSFSEDMALMYEWFISTGYTADVEALRSEHPEVGWHRFGDWAASTVRPALQVSA